ncbi:MAG TPA: NAD-dependent succinate-semialdehyde dehydrogenase [Candidatus Binatia bacterium]|nr:NAD-dependent succinate-semialdehyde dehydrogenase [Candidatus Binatia bacterium]
MNDPSKKTAMPFVSTNPATGEAFAEHPEHDGAEIARRLDLADRCFEEWRETTFAERAALMKRLAALFREKKRAVAEMASREMGRPITAAMAEVEKCALVCDYYADNAEKMLAPEPVDAGTSESYVRFDPLGAVLAVMPWNFAYWQVMRFAAPALMAGNVGLLKHASNVQGCAIMLEELFREAGFPTGAFQNLAVRVAAVEGVLRDKRVKAATLTGSEKAGASVASICGQEIKTTVLELGGSDPYVVLADADIEACARVAVEARLQNAGQSCIAAKRFIVVSAVHDRFVKLLMEGFAKVVVGDPLDEKTTMGPLSTEGGLKDVERQVADSAAMGAKIVCGGNRVTGPGWFYEPTILTGVKKGMPAYDEETFGPAAAVIEVANEEEAIAVANDTDFGLGAALWTRDIARAKLLAARLNAGFVAINNMVKSDPRLPFGGIGKSGYGRELSHYGIKEFVNIKTVRISAS